MKRIYIVRHGQSEGNAGLFRQSHETPLTETGRSQAAAVAERCARLPVEVIVSSTMHRAKETASLIADKLGKNVTESELFVERRRPTEVRGKVKTDPEVIRIETEVRERFGQPDWHFSDEENFDDVKSRALHALAYLEARPEDNILVVTHGIFSTILAACVVFGEGLTGQECRAFIDALYLENTGLTVFEYGNERFVHKKQPWGIWTWNDHSHLG